MKTELGPMIDPLHLLTLGHRHPRRPRHSYGGTGKLPPRVIRGVGVVISPRITLRMFSTSIAALVEVQTRTRMGYSVGQSHSQALLKKDRTTRVHGGLLTPSSDRTCRRV